MSDTCVMRELTDAELDGVCGGHVGITDGGTTDGGISANCWGQGTSWAVSSAIRSIPSRRRS